AIALKDFDVVQRELKSFVHEDPSNPLAPAARQNLETLARSNSAPAEAAATAGPQPVKATFGPAKTETFPNSDRLRTQLAALGDDTNGELCSDCSTAEATTSAPAPSARPSTRGWTIRQVVDEVAVFFAVTDHGRVV